jgi:hexosaminidase
VLRGEGEVIRGLIPRPRLVELGSGSVVWRSPLRVSVPGEWRYVVEVFAADLLDAVGWDVEIVAGPATSDILIRRVAQLGPEEYRASVREVTTIDSSSAAGAAYALAVLRQLGPDVLWSHKSASLESVELPVVDLEDGPRFAWRGVHLDVARHFWDVATVCRLIDQLAAHRLNRLHLHLNDDQGWRIEVPAWPRLTEVGSSRRSSPLGHENEGVDDNVEHRGFFSAADVEAIGAHAAKRHVMIVPEIDLPGHAQAAIAAYPELGNLAEPLEVWTRWGISEHVLNVGSAALDFAGEVVQYVADLFPGSPVHIGGDECPTREWESSEAAQAIMRDHGFTDARQLQGLFTQRMSSVLQAAGREVVAWDEVLDAEVLDGTVIVAWRDSQKGVEAARRGFDVVMAPMQFLYFDWLNSERPDEPVALAPPPYVTPWEKVYRFSVIPQRLEAGLHGRIRGAQAQLWSEYISTRDHLDYMAFPRLAAFSEVVWGTVTSPDEFRTRLETHSGRLEAMGVRFRPLDSRE